MPDETDVTLGSSTSESLDSTTDSGVSSAANDTQLGNQTTETAVTDGAESSGVGPPDDATAQNAVDYLTGKKSEKATKPEAKKVTDPAVPPKEESKSEVKDDEAFGEDYSERDRKLTGRKAEKRIRELHGKWKESETRFENDPIVQQGREFAAVVDEHGVRADLADLGQDGDKAVAGSIRFNAALNRIFTGKPKAGDQQAVSSVLTAMDTVRKSLGLEASGTSESVLKELEDALTQTKEDYDLTRLEKLVSKLKEKKPAPMAIQPRQEQQVTQRPEQEDPRHAVEQSYEADRLGEELTKDGVKDHAKYVADKLWPRLVNSLRDKYPQHNPVALYKTLSPSIQRDLHVRAHKEVQKSLQAIKPVAASPANTTRPVSGTGTRAASSKGPETGAKAAISFLSGG